MRAVKILTFLAILVVPVVLAFYLEKFSRVESPQKQQEVSHDKRVSSADLTKEDLANKTFLLSFFPQEVYLNESATFTLTGKPGEGFSVTLNDKKLGDYTIDSSGIYNCKFTFGEPGNLSFRSKEKYKIQPQKEPVHLEYSVRLLAASAKAKIEFIDGYLYADEMPTILLVDHKTPPKHDRKWETVKTIKNVLGTDKKKVSKGSLIGAGFIKEELSSELSSKLDGLNWQHYHHKTALCEIDQAIVDIESLDHKELVVLALSTKDLDRGMNATRYRLRLEWLLQRIKFKEIAHPYIISFPFNQTTYQKYSAIDKEIRLAVDSNGAEFIKHPFHKMPQPIQKDEWLNVLSKHLKRKVSFQ